MSGGAKDVDRLISGLPRELQPIAQSLRRLVEHEAKGFAEGVKWGNPVWWGNGNAIYLMTFPDRINLGFFRGPELSAAQGLLEGTGKGMRHVKVRSLVDTRNPALRRLIRDAVRLDRAHRP